MIIRAIAATLATVTLLAVIVVGVFIAAPSVAQALQQPEPASPVSPRAAATVTAPTTTPTAAPSAYSGPLIAPRGSRQITRGELHAWAAARPFFGQDKTNDAIWERQQWLDIKCMAHKGFLDDPTNPAFQDHQVGTRDGLTAKEAEAYSVAMDGPQTDAPYDWRTAGCHGRAVHVTGQDNAH